MNLPITDTYDLTIISHVTTTLLNIIKEYLSTILYKLTISVNDKIIAVLDESKGYNPSVVSWLACRYTNSAFGMQILITDEFSLYKNINNACFLSFTTFKLEFANTYKKFWSPLICFKPNIGIGYNQTGIQCLLINY